MSGFREPAVAGLFYPSNPEELTSVINSYITAYTGEMAFSGGIVAPHAGYIYSGVTAASAYASLPENAFKTIIILSPSHREYFHGCSVYPGEGYTTPLGNVKIDSELRSRLIAVSPQSVFLSLAGHRKEHAVEVHIPYIQHRFPDAAILPVVMGDQTPAAIDNLASVLAEIYTEDILIVASTDLSHFYTAATAEQKDNRFADLFELGDDATLERELNAEITEACGGGLVVAMMRALKQHSFTKGQKIEQTHSGIVSGDMDEVVGYFSGKMTA